MINIGFQPRHFVDVKDPDDYKQFLLHKSIMNQYLTHRLFEVKRPTVEKPKKKSNNK
jgi:hypothetical protein